MLVRMLEASLALGAVSLLQEKGCSFHHEKALAQAGKQTTEEVNGKEGPAKCGLQAVRLGKEGLLIKTLQDFATRSCSQRLSLPLVRHGSRIIHEALCHFPPPFYYLAIAGGTCLSCQGLEMTFIT